MRVTSWLPTNVSGTKVSSSELCRSNAQASSKHQEIDLAVTYSAEYSNLTSGSNFWRQGGGIEFSAEAFHGLGVAANVTGTHINTAVNSGVWLTTITTTFGPRYMWSKRKVTGFGPGA